MDYENPLALVNLVPKEVREAIEKVPMEWVKMDEDEFEAAHGEMRTTVCQLRYHFWNEFDRAIDQRTLMSMANVYTACCSRVYWHKILEEPKSLAYILIPPASYLATTEELSARGLKRIRDILSLPIKRPNGEVDTRAAEVILKAVMFLDMRLKGGFTHRSEQISLNVNQNTHQITHNQGTPDPTKNPIQNLDAEIAELQAQIARTGGSGGAPDPGKFMKANKGVIDVESQTSDPEVAE